MDTSERTLWNASLSTMWAMEDHPLSLADFYAAAMRLGFARVELNHQVDSAYLQGADLTRLAISSIHEPCPADISMRVLAERDWQISAVDEESRRQGVLAIQRSIDLAGSLGIRSLVVHPGNVRIGWPREKELLRLYHPGQPPTPRFLETRQKLIAERAELAPPRLEAVRRSLVELLNYAAPRQVRLGLENRYHYMDIPLPDEMESLLALAGPGVLGFWYDVGHAQTLDNLELAAHESWLTRFASRMVGVHLHDVVGISDHQAPGSGRVDFSHIAGYLPADAVRTLELKPGTSAAQVEQSLRFLAQKGIIRPVLSEKNGDNHLSASPGR